MYACIRLFSFLKCLPSEYKSIFCTPPTLIDIQTGDAYSSLISGTLLSIGGSRGRVAGVATPPPLVGKFYPKRSFWPFLGLQPPFPDRMVGIRGCNPLFQKFLDPPMLSVRIREKMGNLTNKRPTSQSGYFDLSVQNIASCRLWWI